MSHRKYRSMSELSELLGTDRKRISITVDALGIPTYRLGKAKCLDESGLKQLRKALRPKPEYMPA